MAGDTVESFEVRQIVQHLNAVELRLIADYDGDVDVTEEQVHRVFVGACARFVNARVSVYVPILVERAVRRELLAG